jgi:uncharacterized membrane protein
MTSPIHTPELPGPVDALTRVVRVLGWVGAAGASVGLALATVVLWPDLAAYLTQNTVPPGHRAVLLGAMGGGLLAGGALALAVAWRSYARADQLALRAAPLVVAGFIPPMFSIQGWRGHEVSLLVLLLGSVVALERLATRAQAAEPFFTWRRTRGVLDWLRTREGLAAALLGLLVAAFAVYFSVFTIGNHHALRTSSFDLGIEENILWNAGHFGSPLRTTPLGPPYTHLGYHQTWISYLIGPLYLLWPRAEFLLVLQATVVALAAVPLFLLARRRLGAWWGLLLAFLYLIYGPLHGSIMYDFHYQPFSNVLVLAALYCLLESKLRWATVFIVLTLLLREDMSIPLAIFGAALVLIGERPRAGALVAAISAVHFVVLKFLVMPQFLGGASAYIHQYAGLLPPGEDGFGGILKTVFANPGFTVNSLLDAEKLRYTLEILAPLALISFRRPIGWLLALPGFFFTLLSTKYQPLVLTSFQYTTYWTIFLFMGAVWTLERLSVRGRRAWVLPLLVGGVVGSAQFGAIVRHEEARGSWQTHRFGLTPWEKTRYEQVRRLVEQIPGDESVVASERLVPHISNRADAYSMRSGLQDALWLFTGNAAWDADRVHIPEALRGDYGIVAREGEFIIARKGHPKTLNEQYLKEMGFPPPPPPAPAAPPALPPRPP